MNFMSIKKISSSNRKTYHNNDVLKNFFEDITNTRKDLGISQCQLSSLTGIAQAKISRLETGRTNNPSFSTLQKLANALGKKIVIKLI